MARLKVLSQKDVFKARFFRINEKSIQFPAGVRIHHNVLKDPIVAVFPIDASWNVYLIRQYRYLLNDTVIEAVAGHIDKGEKPIDTAKRELSEETGIKAAQWEHMGMIEGSASVVRSVAHLFLARELEFGEPHPEEGEDISFVKMPLREAVEKIMSLEIRNSTTMVGLFLLREIKRRKKQ